MAPYTVIGQPVARPDGVDKVTGTGRYTADHPLPGTLWGRCLHSPYSHARILRIDVEEGDEVFGGQALAMVEAMKMENVLRAERNAKVAKVRARPGDSLSVDDVILEFE